jgi:hypothetical protein
VDNAEALSVLAYVQTFPFSPCLSLFHGLVAQEEKADHRSLGGEDHSISA